MKKISLIIPVYNVEKYVAKCIESCINQNLNPDDYEIIIINDGSTDKSLEIVNAVVEKQDNIIVFSQRNSGLSLARNKGLELAQGEYIWFIDSDDWIETNCLNSIIEKLNKIDILAMGYVDAYDDVTKNNKVFPSAILCNTGIDLLKSSYIVPAQFYIYNKNFLTENNLFFEPEIFHEDFEFTPRMLYVAKNIVEYNHQVYFFYKRPGSITTSVNPKKSFDLIKIILNLISFEKKFVEKKHKYIFHNMIWLALNNALHNSLLMDKKNKVKLNKELYLNKWIFSYLNLTTINKYKFERIIFMLFPQYTSQLYKILTQLKSQ
jgi:glycosyltransferase involved in cell wall biosynthesis